MTYVPPALQDHEGSWILVRRSDGAAVMEVFRGSSTAKALKFLNAEKYEAAPIGAYLAGLNKEIAP